VCVWWMCQGITLRYRKHILAIAQGLREDLSAQAVGNALYDLQSMSSDAQEVQDVLVVLTSKIEHITLTHNSKCIVAVARSDCLS
jgi:hypothetical protein